MSYTPTTWVTGDVITAEKLNNMESGIAEDGDVFIIHATGVASYGSVETTPTLDKTFQEISNAVLSNKNCIIISETVYSIELIPYLNCMKNPDGSVDNITFRKTITNINDNQCHISVTQIIAGSSGNTSTYKTITLG